MFRPAGALNLSGSRSTEIPLLTELGFPHLMRRGKGATGGAFAAGTGLIWCALRTQPNNQETHCSRRSEEADSPITEGIRLLTSAATSQRRLMKPLLVRQRRYAPEACTESTADPDRVPLVSPEVGLCCVPPRPAWMSRFRGKAERCTKACQPDALEVPSFAPRSE